MLDIEEIVGEYFYLADCWSFMSFPKTNQFDIATSIAKAIIERNYKCGVLLEVIDQVFCFFPLDHGFKSSYFQPSMRSSEEYHCICRFVQPFVRSDISSGFYNCLVFVSLSVFIQINKHKAQYLFDDETTKAMPNKYNGTSFLLSIELNGYYQRMETLLKMTLALFATVEGSLMYNLEVEHLVYYPPAWN